MPKRAWLALGGNINEPIEHFNQALQQLPSLGVDVQQVSKLYRTKALLPAGSTDMQPDYWNAVCGVHTDLTPHALLSVLQQLEQQAGRVIHKRWQARPLDLDILCYEAMIYHDATLTLPHPELSKRVFVLQPWADIAPDWMVAGLNLSVQQLLQQHPPWSGILEVSTFKK